jgi:HlyD family secretion protein
MQIEASVGELDVASVHKGQPVRFTLESLPGRSFSGEVETLRMIPSVSSNVVSYTVIVKVENLDGVLLPGMTCAVDFIVERSEDVLMVSNAALRYQPTNLSEEKIADMVFNAGLANMNDEQRKAAQEARAQQAQNADSNANPSFTSLMMGGGQGPRMLGGGRQRGARQRGGDQGQNQNEPPAIVMRNLWYIGDDGKLSVMQVRAGISSGSFTEIHSREDIEGKQVILREKI